MIPIEKLDKKVETLIEKIRNLSYPFVDVSLETEADKAKDDTIASLEAYLDLAQTDAESSGDREEEEPEESM